MKKTLSLLLSLVMLLSVTAGISFEAQAMIGLAQKKITITSQGGKGVFEFTPTETGDYYFWADSDGMDTTVNSLYEKSSGEECSWDGFWDDGFGMDFCYYCHLKKGVTYVLKCKYWEDENTGSFWVYVDKTPIKSVTFTPVKAKKYTELTYGTSIEYESGKSAFFYLDYGNHYDDFFAAGDKITLTMTSGAKQVYTANKVTYGDDDEYYYYEFVDKNGKTLDMVYYDSCQWVYDEKEEVSVAKPWKVGTHNVTMYIADTELKLPVEITARGWYKSGGKWHYSKDGDVKGWLKDGGKWYYTNSSGVMLTGWQKISGKWYYLNASGAMVTGWQKIGGVWYYFNSAGAMLTGWQKISGKWYCFNGSGAMVTGWQKIGGIWYYFNSAGDMKTGWLKDGGKWYYFNSSGAMLASTSQKIGGKTYKFNASGACTNP